MPERRNYIPEDPKRYELLNKLGRFKLVLETFQQSLRRSNLILEAAQDLPASEKEKDKLIDRFRKECDAWQDSARILLDDHIAPLIAELTKPSRD